MSGGARVGLASPTTLPDFSRRSGTLKVGRPPSREISLFLRPLLTVRQGCPNPEPNRKAGCGGNGLSRDGGLGIVGILRHSRCEVHCLGEG